MKADLTRWTFEAAKHYRTVRMQQGRVQLDADWNEQQDITHHRVETETLDVVGESGVPVGGDFEVTGNGGDLRIAAGRAYVHGMLCENDALTSVTTQPDWPSNASPILPAGATLTPMPPANSVAQNHIVVYDNVGAAQNPADGRYLAYLEVWQRHLTLLEDPLIHEVALGDPDTATREKTVWQVKLMRAGDLGDNITCASAVSPWTALTTPPDGTLAARSEPTTPPSDDCMLSPDAGFRSLSNLLYRVEIHDDGSLSKLRFKWSHDNGAIATKVVTWLGAPNADEFEVASIGRDDTLAIVAGCWVEFYDDVHELLGQPGSLVPVLKTAGNVVTVDLPKAIGSLDPALFRANPRVRRWDGVVDATTAPSGSGSGWTPLESGVEVKLTPGKYRIGDYWLIPARVASADVEWPKVGGVPAFLPPRGVLRAFMRLGVFQVAAGVWTRLWDCRPQFPALSELTELVYVGGDAQVVIDGEPLLLPKPLEVGVVRGSLPVSNAVVRFTASSGTLTNGLAVYDAPIGPADRGIAKTSWTVDGSKPHQYVSAELLEDGVPSTTHYLPVHFSAHVVRSCECVVHVTPAQQAADGTALQRAIKTLMDRGGGTLCLDSGTYDLPVALALDGLHDVAIRGEGRALTTVRCAGSLVIDGGSVRNLSFERLALESNGQVNSRVAMFAAVDGIVLDQVEFRGALEGSTGIALLVQGPQTNARASDCVFRAESGWWASDSVDAFDAELHASRCHFQCVQYGLILWTEGTQVEARIRDCRFDGCVQGAISVTADDVRRQTIVDSAVSIVEIEGNQFSISGQGISVSAPLVRIVGNCLSCTDPKSTWRAMDAIGYDCCIEGNRIVGFQDGVLVVDAERASVTRNHVIGATTGLAVMFSRHVSVDGNVLEALDQFPLEGQEGVTDLIAIRVDGMDSISVTSNKISGVGLKGLASGATVSGIQVWGGDKALVSGNVFTDFAPAGPYGASPIGIEVVGIQGPTDVSGNVIRRQEGDPQGINSPWTALHLGLSSDNFARFTAGAVHAQSTHAEAVERAPKDSASRKKASSAAKPAAAADVQRPDVPMTLPIGVASDLDRVLAGSPSLASERTQEAWRDRLLQQRGDWLVKALGASATAAGSWVLVRNMQLVVRGNLIGGHGGTAQVVVDMYQDRPTNCDFSGNQCVRTTVVTTAPVQEVVRVRAGSITACHNTVDAGASSGQAPFWMTLFPIFGAYTALANAVTRPGIGVNGSALPAPWAPLNVPLN